MEKYRPRFVAYENLCKELGAQSADVALAFLLRQKAVTSSVIGSRTLEQLNGSMRTLEITLSQGMLTLLDEAFPGPGGSLLKPMPGEPRAATLQTGR